MKNSASVWKLIRKPRGLFMSFWVFTFTSYFFHELKPLDSILKSRDITLPTKVHLVKAMAFPVVIYGCESWIVKKAERRRIDAFEL